MRPPMTHDQRPEGRTTDLGGVGGDDLESLDGVGDVLDLLEDAVGVDVAVGAPDGAVGVAHLLLGGEAVLVAVVVAVGLVLRVELLVHVGDNGHRGGLGHHDGGGGGGHKRLAG